MTRRHISILISCEVEDGNGDFALCVADVLRQHAMNIEDPQSSVRSQRFGTAYYWDTGREVKVKWAGDYPNTGFFQRIKEAWRDWRDDAAYQKIAERGA